RPPPHPHRRRRVRLHPLGGARGPDGKEARPLASVLGSGVQTRTRNALVFGAAAAAGAAGLFAITRSRRPLDLSAKVLDAVPAGALLVATADLSALRASPATAPLLKEGREIPGLGKVRDVCGFDPLDTLTEAAIAIPATGDTGEFGLVATGPIDADALVACASKVIDARGGHAVTSTLGSF